MTFKKIMKEIESHNFAAYLNVVGNFENFINTIKKLELVWMLLEELNSEKKVQKLAKRVLDISGQKIDPKYENPKDIALSIYIWLISLKDLELAKMIAKTAIQIPQSWWTKRMSYKILDKKE